MSALTQKLNALLTFLNITDNYVPIYLHNFAARMPYGQVTAIKRKNPTVPTSDDNSQCEKCSLVGSSDSLRNKTMKKNLIVVRYVRVQIKAICLDYVILFVRTLCRITKYVQVHKYISYLRYVRLQINSEFSEQC